MARITKKGAGKGKHALSGVAKSKAHRMAISEGLKRHHAGKRKLGGKIVVNARVAGAVDHNVKRRAKLKAQIKDLKLRITVVKAKKATPANVNALHALKADLSKLRRKLKALQLVS